MKKRCKIVRSKMNERNVYWYEFKTIIDFVSAVSLNYYVNMGIIETRIHLCPTIYLYSPSTNTFK